MKVTPKHRMLAVLLTSLALAAGCRDSGEAPTTTPQKPRPTARPAESKTPPPDVEGSPATAPTAASPGDPEIGKVDYQTLCSSCHGPTGDGDGPVAATLDPRPARHSDGNYMNALTDDHLFQVIKFGGPSVNKSPMMAPFGGSLSDQQIRNIIAFIRTLADPPYRAPGSASN